MYLFVHYIHAWYPWRSKEDVGSPRAGARDGCGPFFGCWDEKPGRLQEHPGLLTTEPLFRSLKV